MWKKIKKSISAFYSISLSKREFKKILDIVSDDSSLEEKAEKLNNIKLFNKDNKILVVYLDMLFGTFENRMNESLENNDLDVSDLLNSTVSDMCQKVFESAFLVGKASSILKERERAILVFIIFPILISTGMFSMGSIVDLLNEVKEFNGLSNNDLLNGIAHASQLFSSKSFNIDNIKLH